MPLEAKKSGVGWISARIIIIQRRILGLEIGSGESSGLINHCWNHVHAPCPDQFQGVHGIKTTGTDSSDFIAFKVSQKNQKRPKKIKY